MERRTVWASAGLLVFAHIGVLVAFPRAKALSAAFVLACSLSATAASFWRRTLNSGPLRRKWDYIASALALWSIGQLILLLRMVAPVLAHLRAFGPEFYFLTYGIPILLAVSSSNEERDAALFNAIDSLQALFAVILIYLELTISSWGFTNPSVGPADLPVFYGAGSWTLAAAALLRLAARPLGQEKVMYRILLVYLLYFAILATPWHGACVLTALPVGIYHDILVDSTFLLLTLSCLLYDLSPDEERPAVEMNSFALVLNNSSPILFTLAVLALGAMIARRHLVLGGAAIGLSLVTYCFRSALLQSAYVRAQHALTRSQFALREANSQLRQLSLHDALTGLPNRRQFDLTIELEWSRAIRNRRPLSLLLLDVDYFKALNDLYGHPAGDDCLQRIAGALQGSLRRASEMAARYGGEEFAAILPDADLPSAVRVAETIRENVLALQVLHEGSQVERFVTLSAGVATVYPSAEESPSSLIASADAALYRAKRRGRNRVEMQQNALLASSPRG